MKKTLTLALVALSLLGADAFGRRCCKKQCPPKCPPKRACQKESWEVDRFGYLVQSCDIARTEYDPGYSLVKCNVVCYKEPCGGCQHMDAAKAQLEDEGYTVIDKSDVEGRVAGVARQHMMSKM